MKTYSISVEVTSKGVTKVFRGFLKAVSMEKVQEDAFSFLQELEEFKKDLNFYEVVECKVVDKVARLELKDYGLKQL